jgi:tyrosine-protein phosphatase SIW14
MSAALRWFLIACICFIVIVVPIGYYRYVYDNNKRLRVMVPDRVYRGGQMTAVGLTDAVHRLHIKTIINVQDDVPDPDLDLSFWNTRTIKESELCKNLDVRFVQLAPDLISRREIPEHRPATIDQFLSLLDDPSVYPVLIHCRAGLHRTGVLAAIYRMEYQGWSHEAAYSELRAHGFGDWVSTSANLYILEYVLSYQPGLRHGVPVTKPHEAPTHPAAQPSQPWPQAFPF